MLAVLVSPNIWGNVQREPWFLKTPVPDKHPNSNALLSWFSDTMSEALYFFSVQTLNPWNMCDSLRINLVSLHTAIFSIALFPSPLTPPKALLCERWSLPGTKHSELHSGVKLLLTRAAFQWADPNPTIPSKNTSKPACLISIKDWDSQVWLLGFICFVPVQLFGTSQPHLQIPWIMHFPWGEESLV